MYSSNLSPRARKKKAHPTRSQNVIASHMVCAEDMDVVFHIGMKLVPVQTHLGLIIVYHTQKTYFIDMRV